MNMNRLFIYALLVPLLVLVSCQKDKPDRDLMERDELVPLLIDLHLVYAIQSTTDFRELSRKVDSVDTYSYIFEKYGIQKVVFDSTIAWYSRHPKHFTEIYDEVVMTHTLRVVQDPILNPDKP